MRLFKFLTLLLSFSLLSSIAINDSLETILRNLDHYFLNVSPDKVYIHSDRSMYALEDTIWLKTYMVDGITHLPNAASKVVHIELIDPNGSVVNSHKVYIDNKGAASDITIPREWSAGDYSIRAYSRFMLNQSPDYFFYKKIKIVDVKKAYDEIYEPNENLDSEIKSQKNQALDIKFYPESGELIAGIDCKVAIKIRSQQAEGLTGSIQTKSGNTVAPFKIFKFGLGIASFIPEEGVQYVAKIDGEVMTYPLPDVKPKGYHMTIVKQKKNITLILKTNRDSGLNGGKIIAHQRGQLLIDQDISEDTRKEFSLKFATDSIPSGIITYTFFDSAGLPQCERLVFVDNSEVSTIIKTDKSTYRLREKVNLELLIDDQKTLSKYDCSISVVDNNNIQSFSESTNIKTWLLLNSDLRGKIENPSYFFEKYNDSKRAYLLDLVMMTNGWRRFTWSEMSKQDAHSNLKHDREIGMFIKGYVSELNNNIATVKSNVTLTFLNADSKEDQLQTEIDGKFSFGPYIVYDTVQAFIQARKYKNDKQDNLKGKRNLDIHLDEKPIFSIHGNENVETENISSSAYNDYITNNRSTQALKDQYHNMEVMLNEIVLTEKKKTEEDRMEKIQKDKSYYGNPTNRLIIEEADRNAANSVFDLLQRVPGVTVYGAYPSQTASIRGTSSLIASSPPLYILDGIQTDQDFMNQINASDVLFIDVLKGSRTAIFGSRGSSGVIAVYTGDTGFSSVTRRKPGIVNMTVEGFELGREFYSPDYSKDVSEVFVPDGRTTLYWNPNVKLSNEETVDLDFYTGDNPGTYQVLIEGVGDDGSLISMTENLIVE